MILRIRAESPFPETVAEDDHLRAAGDDVLARLETRGRGRATTPSSEKYGAATNSVWIRSGSSPPTSVIHCESTAAMSSKLFDCARQSR